MNEYDIFVEAASKQGSELDAFLAQACADAPDMLQRVGALLQAHRQSSGFLDELSINSNGAVEPAENVGTTIGNYKLLEQIGEGGFGIVYMAEQSVPIRRRVALKIIKLGMDTRQFVARFEAERQAMAMMDHPNIASMYDAGATDSGRPYFVMELVRGESITTFCDCEKQSTRQRLQMFVDVCRAVQHAHLKGIIHRDIKPSNVLITIHDGKPQPKVIDFGIAKATEEPLTDKTVFTQFRQMIGTPAYMSPEQAMLNATDVDTRTDVYSLGVLLYELLTGKTPLDLEQLNIVGGEELLRKIREDDAPSLRAKLSTLSEGDRMTVAENRNTKSFELARSVDGELNWIVAKALSKDRTRRYQTASALADDVVRLLNDQPVSANPPSHTYYAMKFVRRNRTLVAAVCATSAALIIGLCLALGGLVQAQRQTKIAIVQADRAEKILELFRDVLMSADPERGRDPNFTVRELLDEMAENVPPRLDGDLPDVEAEVHHLIGKTYGRLGLRNDAQLHLQKVVELRKACFGENHFSVANAYVDLAQNAFARCRERDAIEASEHAIAVFQQQGKPVPPELEKLNQTATALWNLHVGIDQKQSEFLHHTLLNQIEEVLGGSDQLTGTLVAKIIFLYLDLGDYQTAADLCDVDDKRFRASHPAQQRAGRATTNSFLSLIYNEFGDRQRARELYPQLRRDTADERGWYENNPWMKILAALTLVQDPTSTPEELGRAQIMAAEFVGILKKYGVKSSTRLCSERTLALAYARNNDLKSAISTLRGVLDADYSYHSPFLRGLVESELAGFFENVQQPDAARKVLEDGVAWRKEKLPPNYVQISVAELNLALHLMRFPSVSSRMEASTLLNGAYERVKDRAADDHYRTTIEKALGKL